MNRPFLYTTDTIGVNHKSIAQVSIWLFVDVVSDQQSNDNKIKFEKTPTDLGSVQQREIQKIENSRLIDRLDD